MVNVLPHLYYIVSFYTVFYLHVIVLKPAEIHVYQLVSESPDSLVWAEEIVINKTLMVSKAILT